MMVVGQERLPMQLVEPMEPMKLMKHPKPAIIEEK
jgi:hypothetical protein